MNNRIKELPRNQICILFDIGSPIWNGGEKKVGLNLRRIRKHNEIHFTYRRKSDSKLSLPDPYYFDGDNLKGMGYDTQNRGNVTLVLIPFKDLQILHRIDVERPDELGDNHNIALPRGHAKWYRHTTHYACQERIQIYGGKTVGCCCTGHECKKEPIPENGSLL